MLRTSARSILKFIHSHRCYTTTTTTPPPPHPTPILLHPSEIPPPRLDYRSLSDNVTSKSLNALNRKAPIPSTTFPSLARAYAEWKRLSVEVNQKRNRRSLVGEMIHKKGFMQDENGQQQEKAALEEAINLKSEIKTLEAKLSSLESLLLNLALPVPNDTHPSSPLGPESAAKIIYESHSTSTLLPADPIRDHIKVGTHFSLIDFKSGATTTGHSWYFLQNEGALLELALTNYALSLAIKRGYVPVIAPDVVRSDIAYRCGFQPRDVGQKAASHMYHIAPSHPSSPELILSGTAEIALAGSLSNKVLPSQTLPLKLVGVSHSFRAEAGARSAETRGLYRVHQFTKVELFVACQGHGNEEGAKGSEEMMEEMLDLQKEVLDGLRLPYRVLDMPSEELGASAYRKYDIEAWMPGRGSWGEVTSLSNCTDYQSRRLHIRCRPHPPSTSSPTSPPVPASRQPLSFAHTLNGTAAAIPRLIVALLENGAVFDEEGRLKGVRLPNVLRPFWVGDVKGREVVFWDED